MKIVYCIAATHNSGGMERVLANKANYLVRSSMDVHIVTTDQQRRASFFALDARIHCHDLGINYVDNNGVPLLRKLLSYRKKQIQHRDKLTALLNSLRADIVISMFDHEVSFLYDIADGSKKILEIHFSRFKRLQYGRTGIWALVNKWRSGKDADYARKYARFVVLTEEDKGYWGDFDNIMVIPNANSFNPVQTADLSRKRVIAVGRYDYQKGFDELIQAWSLVAQENKDWSLHIFGDGPLKADLQRLIAQLDMQDQVFLKAPVKNIEAEYVNSAMLAMTSRYEGLPMALLEAQACGLPLLAYACKCGPRDIIRDGENGFLLEEGDRHALAQRLQQLMDDTALRKAMGRAALLRSALYSEQVVMQTWMQLFNETLQIHITPGATQ